MPDPDSNIHDDTWMTDAYATRHGPLGRRLRTVSHALPPAVCGPLAFDSYRRIVSVCPSALAAPRARIIDPVTLEERDAREPDTVGVVPRYWTAISVRTGRIAWQRRAGVGPSFNNNLAGLSLRPDATAYLGTIGGLLSLRDG